jgi:hypothetical protein
MADAIKAAITGDLLASVLRHKCVVTLPTELTQAGARFGTVFCKVSEPLPQFVPEG